MILMKWRGLGWVVQSRSTARIIDRHAPDAMAHAANN
jgi:hypothetical protein